MHDLGSESGYDPRNAAKTHSSTARIYGRLVARAWAYKTRLLLSLFFALVVAASFGSMIFTAGSFFRLIVGQEEVLRFRLPAEAVAPVLAEAEAAGWFTGDVDQQESGGATTLTAPINADSDAWPAVRIAEELGRRGAAAIQALPRQALSFAEEIGGLAGRAGVIFGDAAAQWPERFLSLVARMRAHIMLALGLLSIALIALVFTAGVARFLQEYFAGSIGVDISVGLMREMYENVIHLPIEFFEKRATGELLARFTNDVFMVNRGLASVFVKLLREPFKAVMFLVLALSVDPLLTLVGLCVLPPVGYVIVSIGKKVKRSVRRSLERVANVASVAKESFAGISIVKSFCMEQHQIARVQQELVRLRRYMRQMIKADAAVGPLSEFVMVLGIVVFMLLSGRQLERGVVDGGDLVVLFFSLAAMLDPMRKLASVNNAVQTSVASAERVFEFIDAKPNLVERPDARPLPRLSEALRFEDVHFAYPGHEEVIHGVSFEVRKGQMIALVGFSGSGKTTLAKLVPRFYDPTAGRITLDGVDLRDGTFESLRGQIGVVTQETVLFDESVRNNIACGNAYDDARIREAARIAQAAGFVEALPDGFETSIGEGGGALSGGQRQRLAIARALAKDPAILILDEATSSLDSESERAIQQAIEESIVGRTTIVIAHRLSTIQRADCILVLDGGRIVEQGAHADLLGQDGLYKRLYDVQFGAAEEAAE